MIDDKQLRVYIIRPTLKSIKMYSEDAEELLMLTAAAESGMGRYVRQLPDGPAVGLYQMEPRTYYDIYDNWLSYRDHIEKRIVNYCGYLELPNADRLMDDLRLSTCMARVNYFRVPEKIPDKNDINGLSEYWKKYHNTENGKGVVSEGVEKYKTYVTARR